MITKKRYYHYHPKALKIFRENYIFFISFLQSVISFCLEIYHYNLYKVDIIIKSINVYDKVSSFYYLQQQIPYRQKKEDFLPSVSEKYFFHLLLMFLTIQ